MSSTSDIWKASGCGTFWTTRSRNDETPPGGGQRSGARYGLWMTVGHGGQERGWFDPIAQQLGKAYWAPNTGRVMAFTKGTAQEVEFLVGALALEPGMRVLDVGCGPGRHALALASRGCDVVGIDRSAKFVQLARATAEAEALPVAFVELDVRDLAYDAEFD